MCINDILRSRPIEGVDPDLTQKVCAALYLKRQGLRTVPIDIEKMCEYFKASREDLVKIMRWYEGQLLETKFVEY